MNIGVVLVDTREQYPFWDAGDHDVFGFQFTVERATLKTADYTIKGMEKLVLVERKSSVDEIATCCSWGRDRFERELRRMADETEHGVLVIEEPMISVHLHRYRSRMSPASLLGTLAAWSWRYQLSILWAGTRGLAAEITLRHLAAVARDPERARAAPSTATMTP